MSASTPGADPPPLPTAWDWRARYRYYRDLPGRLSNGQLWTMGIALLVVALVIVPILSSRCAAGPGPAILLVTGVPVGATAARYGALSEAAPHVPVLERVVTVTDRTTAARLAADANALPAFPSGPISCPNDDGSYYRIAFSYVDGGGVTLFAQRKGCQGVGFGATPGRSVAWSATDGRLLRDLDALFV